MKKILIITSSGGGGLIQAANAKEQEAKTKNAEITIVRRDVLIDWMGKRFGHFCMKKWNDAQISGNVDALRFLIASQQVFDYFTWPYLFIRTLSLLFIEGIDHVIDTQPMGTSAILKALRIYSFFKKKDVILQKVLVDLPTKAATHFFKPIKRLSKKDRSLLKLTTIAPLLDEGETEEDFWQSNCRLTTSEIDYEDVNVRQSFCKFQNQPRSKEKTLFSFCFKNEEELSLIQKCLNKSAIKPTVNNKEISFSLSPSVKVMSIILGSQPASGATLSYVRNWVQFAKEPEFSHLSFALFVFCAEHLPNQNDLFCKIAECIEGISQFPENLAVIPFSFQSDDVIAALFHRSDITCTRSGGATAMELMAVSTGDIWIHSETKEKSGDILSQEALLKGIPGWEAANALYLQKLRGAKIVTPETFAPFAQNNFFDREMSRKPSYVPDQLLLPDHLPFLGNID